MEYKIKDKAFIKLLNSLEKIEELKGRVGDYILKYQKTDGSFLYIKYAEGFLSRTLQNEYQRLSWLNKNQNVILIPKVEYFAKEEENTVLVISSIPGEQSQRVAKNIGKEHALVLVARALKDIHSIKVKNIKKFRNTLDSILDDFKILVKDNKISTEEFKKTNENKTPEEVLNYLYKRKPIFQEDVFTHGDYCLPNIIIDSNMNFGVIDWANGGICDRYMDFSAIEGSIKRNFGEEYIELFYRYYGLDYSTVDREKIKYFQLIDQFSYHKQT